MARQIVYWISFHHKQSQYVFSNHEALKYGHCVCFSSWTIWFFKSHLCRSGHWVIGYIYLHEQFQYGVSWENKVELLVHNVFFLTQIVPILHTNLACFIKYLVLLKLASQFKKGPFFNVLIKYILTNGLSGKSYQHKPIFCWLSFLAPLNFFGHILLWIFYNINCKKIKYELITTTFFIQYCKVQILWEAWSSGKCVYLPSWTVWHIFHFLFDII